MREIRRLLILTAIALSSAAAGFPQTAAAPGNEGDLYSIALVASLAEMQKEWGYIDDGGNGRIRTDYRNMPIMQNPEITKNLPPQFGEYRVQYLDTQALIERYKKQPKEFAVLEIHPIHGEGSRLWVNLSVSWFSYRTHRMYFAVSDWSDVDFQYDPEKKAYVVSAVKLGGI